MSYNKIYRLGDALTEARERHQRENKAASYYFGILVILMALAIALHPLAKSM